MVHERTFFTMYVHLWVELVVQVWGFEIIESIHLYLCTAEQPKTNQKCDTDVPKITDKKISHSNNFF